MHTDCYGLPVQADGDKQDQLNRVGLILLCDALGAKENGDERLACLQKWTWFFASRGHFIRYPGGDPLTVSGDQVIPILAWFCVTGRTIFQWFHLLATLRRFGLAQNFKTIEGEEKFPDFLLLRIIPFLVRMHPILYPLALVLDIFILLPMALSILIPFKFKDDSWLPVRVTEDDVDFNCLAATLLACRTTLWTPASLLAFRVIRLCPKKLGPEGDFNNFERGLLHYHRADAGGNPELGLMLVSRLKAFS